jgi:hypothetical protein
MSEPLSVVEFDEALDALDTESNASDSLEVPRLNVPRGDSPATEWLAYFLRNAADQPNFPWISQGSFSDREYLAVADSIRTFQLGESGEGKHILGCARRWTHAGGEQAYLPALKLFIKEENRHAFWLGQLMNQEKILPLKHHWSDGAFRKLRHMAGLRTSIVVLVTAEILAQVYYAALLKATPSPTLIAICRRILRDERAHVAFQQGQSKKLIRHWSKASQQLSYVAELSLFEIARRIVWHDHRSVFQAASMDWPAYRQRTTARWLASHRVFASRRD